MIIEAKANRQSEQPEDPRKRFEFDKPEKSSRLPVYFALIVTGIAAYLKSAFPAQSQSNMPSPDPLGAAQRSGQGPHSRPMEPGLDDIETGSIGTDEPQNSIGNVIPAWPGLMVAPDPVSFNYTEPFMDSFGPWIAPFFPAAVSYRPHNDNASQPSGVSAHSFNPPESAVSTRSPKRLLASASCTLLLPNHNLPLAFATSLGDSAEPNHHSSSASQGAIMMVSLCGTRSRAQLLPSNPGTLLHAGAGRPA